MSKVQTTGFDPKAIDDAKVFSEIYIKLPSDKKAMAEGSTGNRSRFTP